MSTKTNAMLIATLAIVLTPWFSAMPASAIEIVADEPNESLCSSDTINPIPPPCPPYRVIQVGALGSIDIGFADSDSHTYALAARKLSSTGTGPASVPAIVVVDTNTLTVVTRLGFGNTSTAGPNFTPFAGNCTGGLSGPNGVIIIQKPGGILEFWAGDAPIYKTSDSACSFTGHIDDTTVPPPATNPGAGTTLTVTAVNLGKLALNDTVFGTGVALGTTITGTATSGLSNSCGPTASDPCTGTGATGTYAVSVSQNIASETMAATLTLSRASQLVVFGVNQKTWNTTYTQYISTGGKMRADELCYNPVSKVVLIANDNAITDNFISFIDASTIDPVTKTYPIIKKISFAGGDANSGPFSGATQANGIEQCQYNARDGKFYLSVPKTGAKGTGNTGTGPGFVLRISGAPPFKVEAAFEIDQATGCVGPQGLAVGPARQIALGCGGTASLIISDTFSDGTSTTSSPGTVIATVPDGGGADEIWYDFGSNHYYFARSTLTGTNPVVGALGVEDAGSATTAPAPDTTTITVPLTGTTCGCIPTASGSHSVAADSILGLVFVPVTNSAAAAASTVCSGAEDAFHVPGRDNLGCIAVYQSSEPTPEPGALVAPASRSPKGGKKH
jgi:hypothetical protein